ncbi:MAG: prepilin peptidase [Chitinispirillaceae bacterium]|nr:prepilin peptidase [Chitinispirillaceae bacterium]
MTVLFSLFAVIFGLILGSFFNVLICRIPGNESILWPSSHCTSCNTPLKPWYNIPVLSFLFLRGKCSFCKAPISIMYPVVELVTGGAAFVIWLLIIVPRVPLTWIQVPDLALQVLFLLLIIPISVIDLQHYIIPDRLSLSLFTCAIAVAFVPGPLTPLSSLFGILAGGGSLYAVGWIGTILLKKDAMGGGDIKLMAAAGALWGAQNVLLAIIFGALIGSVYGIALMVLRKINSQHQIPFGPFLGGGIWVAVLYGTDILDWYISLMGHSAGR